MGRQWPQCPYFKSRAENRRVSLDEAKSGTGVDDSGMLAAPLIRFTIDLYSEFEIDGQGLYIATPLSRAGVLQHL